MKRFLVLVLLFTAVNAAAAVRGRVIRKPPAWAAPNCTTTFGLPGFYFTRDEGRTVSVNPHPRPVNTGVYVVATDVPNRMFGILGEDLYDSFDAGCNWSLRSRVPVRPTSMVAASGGRAYAWSYDYTDRRLLRVSASSFDSVALPDAPVALGVDPADARHLTMVARLRVYESHDAGSTWSERGDPLPYVTVAGIDSRDVRHIAIGYLATVGAIPRVEVTRDGGMTWQRAETQGVKAWSLAFSPADPNVIWMRGSDKYAPQTVYRSVDGGQTFAVCLSPTVTFNKETLTPSPNDPHIAAYGATQGLAMIDAASSVLSLAPGGDWDTVTWSPVPGVIYLTDYNAVVYDL